MGLAAGLALLTKGSAYIFLPFLVLACWWMGSRSARIRFLKYCPVFLVLIVALNLPQAVRCYGLTGSPLGLPFPDAGPTFRWMVARVSVKGMLANALRNASLHLGITHCGCERADRARDPVGDPENRCKSGRSCNNLADGRL